MIVDEDRRVSQSQLRNEIQRRLDILGYDACRMHQYLLSPKDPVTLTRDLVLYFDAADLGPEGDETMIIQNIETNYGVKVYAAITTQCGELGEMLTLLTIAGNKAEWQREREDLEARMPIAYVQNLTYPELSEWGTVMLKTHDGIVERIG